MAKTIEIDYAPRNWATNLHDSTKRWNVIVAHRRCGKTTACINHLIRDAIRIPGSRFAFIAPYFKQSKAIAWDMLKRYTTDIPGVKKNESELRVDFAHNNSRVQLYGADNPDSLRGIGLNGVVFDEYSQQPSSIFTEVVSKCLADKLGYAIWIGTPCGKNEFHRLYQHSSTDDQWMGLLITIDESLRVETGETIENLKQALIDDKKLVKDGIMGEDEFQQEWYCSFDAAIKGAYYANEIARLRQENRICGVPYQPEIAVNTYWDLGISDTTSIIFAQTIGKEIHVVDYYSNNGYGLDHYAKVLSEKPYVYANHYLPHDVRVRELGTGKSREEVLKGYLGRRKIKVVKDIGRESGINAARAIFNRCWFDTKTEGLVDALAQYTQEWDDKKGMFKDKPLHNWASHPADSFRYMAVGYQEKIHASTSKPIRSKYNRQPSLNQVIKTLKL